MSAVRLRVRRGCRAWSSPRSWAPLVLACLLTSSSCDKDSPPPPTAAVVEPFRMCFVGNSLTYTNDLPAMVAALSRAAGDSPPIETQMVAYPGYALEDHLAQGDAVRAIQKGNWDLVVLQQGPSTLPASRVNLVDYSKRFAAIIRAAGAEPALYGVWPEQARISALDACIESYRVAADSVGGVLFPAGLAWKRAWSLDPALPLYGPDHFHPSPLGTYLAALVVYSVVRHRSPVGLPVTLDLGGTTVVLDSLQARTAQLAAADVTSQSSRGKTVGARHFSSIKS
jgi:hypothetical protein